MSYGIGCSNPIGGTTSRLRLSLTIPGAVSLGAYEGGALAALIVAAKTLGEDKIVIDSIASASAGSITGLLTARSLLRSVDPISLLASTWVNNVSIEAMKTHSTEAPHQLLCQLRPLPCWVLAEFLMDPWKRGKRNPFDSRWH
jgi:hypothetical protein